jgi:hypothetical protein
MQWHDISTARFSRRLTVTGEHHDLQTCFVKLPNRFRSRILDRVGDACQSGGLAVDSGYRLD